MNIHGKRSAQGRAVAAVMREQFDGGRCDEQAVEEMHEAVVVIAPLERGAAERLPPIGVRHERVGVVRADRVEHEEHEQAACTRNR